MIFRWGHFADLHLRFDGFTTQDLRDKLIEELRKHQLHALLIAGDLHHRGDTSDTSRNSIKEFVQAMATAAGCTYQHIYICPGNHDLPRNHVRAHILADIIGAYERPEQPNAEPGLITTGYEPIIHQQVCQPFQHTVNAIRNENVVPILHKVFPTEFANIIILNTAIFAGQTYPGQVGGPDSRVEDTALYIADANLARLRREICEAGLHRSNKLNIVLAHHGTGCFVRTEFKKLATVLDDMGVDLYLCGHVHQNHHQIITHTNYIPQISCGGLFEDGYNSPTFLIGEYNTKTREVTITAYAYSTTQNNWVTSTMFPRPWKGCTLTFVPHRLATQNPYLSILEQIVSGQRLDHRNYQLCTYDFVRQIHEKILPHLKSVDVRKDLEHILQECIRFENGKPTRFFSLHAQRVAFAAYYSLALVYKNDGLISENEPPSIGKLVGTYGELFARDIFPLATEVYSWYYRYTGQAAAAYECDIALTGMLPIEVNAGVYASFASSICALEERETDRTAVYGSDISRRYQDWKRAYLSMDSVIAQWQTTWECPGCIYPKHRFIQGKLLYFAAEHHWNQLEQDNIPGLATTREQVIIQAQRCFFEILDQDNDKATYKTIATAEYLKWSVMCAKFLGQSFNPNPTKGKQNYVNV